MANPGTTPRTGGASPSREGLAAIAPAQPVAITPAGYLRTARMLLRPLASGDQAAYLHAVLGSRTELQAKMPMHKEGESDEQMFARQLRIVSEEQAAGQCFRCVGVLDDGQIAGAFHLNAISRGLEWQADLTWWVATPFTGRGLATEGVRALAEYELGDLPSGLGLHQVHAWITRDNAASIRVAEKAGLIKRPETTSYLDTGASWAIHDKYSRTV